MKNDIQLLLDKYWAGETTLQEEQQLKTYFASSNVSDEFQDIAPLFTHFKSEQETATDFQPDLSFLKKSTREISQPQKSNVRYLFPKIAAVAACFVLFFSIATNYYNTGNDFTYKNKYTEVEDPDEALAIAMEALGFLGNNYEKGSMPMKKHIKNLEKTDVFRFN